VTKTPTPTPTATSTQSNDVIFAMLRPGFAETAQAIADGIKSGIFSAWTSNVTDGGDLSVSGSAALVGSYGMAAMSGLWVEGWSSTQYVLGRSICPIEPLCVSSLTGKCFARTGGLSLFKAPLWD
jgi:hypothetical protein